MALIYDRARPGHKRSLLSVRMSFPHVRWVHERRPAAPERAARLRRRRPPPQLHARRAGAARDPDRRQPPDADPRAAPGPGAVSATAAPPGADARGTGLRARAGSRVRPRRRSYRGAARPTGPRDPVVDDRAIAGGALADTAPRTFHHLPSPHRPAPGFDRTLRRLRARAGRRR